MAWGREPRTRPDRREPSDPDFRHGLMMRDLTELRGRVETLERAVLRQSMHPKAKVAGLASAVAGAVVGALELLRYVGFFK